MNCQVLMNFETPLCQNSYSNMWTIVESIGDRIANRRFSLNDMYFVCMMTGRSEDNDEAKLEVRRAFVIFTAHVWTQIFSPNEKRFDHSSPRCSSAGWLNSRLNDYS